MNTHYTKDDVVELASVIFTNDLNSPIVAQSGITTEELTQASFYAAEAFFNTAAAYQRGELKNTLDLCHGRGPRTPASEPEERRKGERRGSETGSAESTEPTGPVDPAIKELAEIERALKAQFLAATLNSIFRNAAKG